MTNKSRGTILGVLMAVLLVALAASGCGADQATVEREDGTSSVYDVRGAKSEGWWGREECWADGGQFLDRGPTEVNGCIIPPPPDYAPPSVVGGGRAEADVLERVETMNEEQLSELLDHIEDRYGDEPMAADE